MGVNLFKTTPISDLFHNVVYMCQKHNLKVFFCLLLTSETGLYIDEKFRGGKLVLLFHILALYKITVYTYHNKQSTGKLNNKQINSIYARFF